MPRSYTFFIKMLIFFCCCQLITACGSYYGKPASAQTNTGTIEKPLQSTAENQISLSQTQTSCPAAGQARSAIIQPYQQGQQPSIIYVENRGSQPQYGLPTHNDLASLIRYDKETGQKITVLTQENTRIFGAQLSQDGQWILFASSFQQETFLQLVRIDGKGLQTLYCAPTTQSINTPLLSPGMHFVAFSLTSSSAPEALGMYVINLQTGAIQQKLAQSDLNMQPGLWLDETHVYVLNPGLAATPTERHIFLLDITKTVPQTSKDMQTMGTQAVFCGDFDTTLDKKTFLLNQCTQGTQEGATLPPSTLSIQPTLGGTLQQIYKNTALTIFAIKPISDKKLLLFTHTTHGQQTEDALWQMNIDGTQLEQIPAIQQLQLQPYQPFGNKGNPWSVVSRDGQDYSLLLQSATNANTSKLVFGTLAGDPAVTIAQLNSEQGDLQLLGWTLF